VQTCPVDSCSNLTGMPTPLREPAARNREDRRLRVPTEGGRQPQPPRAARSEDAPQPQHSWVQPIARVSSSNRLRAPRHTCRCHRHFDAAFFFPYAKAGLANL
jgi:hypothetical protein